MSQPPKLFDRKAIAQRRARASRVPATERFLHALARDEVEERLTEVNRTFTKPVVVTGFPENWDMAAEIASDQETLPLAEGAHDLVIHALSLHAQNDPVGQLIQCRRALQADGLLMAVLFGGQTLHELRTVLATAESEISGGLSPRVTPMGDVRDLGGLLGRAGFALPVADTTVVPVTYPSLAALVRDLRAMGETNVLANRLRHPTRRAVFKRAEDLYQEHYADEDGRLKATFELVFLTGWAPDPSQQQPLRPGSAKARLADALGTAEFDPNANPPTLTGPNGRKD
ncbi:SAM-dependent methyltransferase [Shimia ponticola]|uniref:SAM-dependent methyltransferase n=1 Tax=Shimia ponticola TaxID=2582893 RepID=UPI0011BEB4FC|nr:SAM-dependent methyltransferase [Shimia ponticola]